MAARYIVNGTAVAPRSFFLQIYKVYLIIIIIIIIVIVTFRCCSKARMGGR